jgi:ribosomal protein S18 acetylase RimI-like enzyme
MTTEIRRATADDIPHLARFQIAAAGGYNEIFYDGLAPDRSLESLVEPQFAVPNTVPFYENHWVAVCDGRIAGGVHAFPFEDVAKFPEDPLVPKERYAMVTDMYDRLTAPGTYNVYVLAVYPEFHGMGVGSTLLSLGLRHGAESGFTECSLHVFAENVAAVALYEKHGFKEASRYPVTRHPLLYHPGDMLLMTCAV